MRSRREQHWWQNVWRSWEQLWWADPNLNSQATWFLKQLIWIHPPGFWAAKRRRPCRQSWQLWWNLVGWMVLIQKNSGVLHKTQSQLVWSFESQSRVKVKVAKLCRKKWFDHNMMYIYHKQYEILQKKSPKQLKHSISVISHWFSVEMVQKGPKLRKRKRFFLRLEHFSEVSRVYHLKADVQGFLKMW